VTRKYLNELYDHEFGRRVVADIDRVTDAGLATLLTSNESVDVALLERRDSDAWRAAADSDASRLAAWSRSFDVRLVLATSRLAGLGSVRAYAIRKRPARKEFSQSHAKSLVRDHAG
jgi:hypothetical protein